MKEMAGIRELGRHKTPSGRIFVFAVRVTQGEVFMKAEAMPSMNEERAVVHVDAQTLVRLWRRDPSALHREWAFGNDESWRADRKFPKAVDGFSYGEEKPVPLANVFCETIAPDRTLLQRALGLPSPMYVGATNGITRTIWLLANGCTTFPIECSMGGALELYRLAGISNTAPRSIEALTEG